MGFLLEVLCPGRPELLHALPLPPAVDAHMMVPHGSYKFSRLESDRDFGYATSGGNSRPDEETGCACPQSDYLDSPLMVRYQNSLSIAPHPPRVC